MARFEVPIKFNKFPKWSPLTDPPVLSYSVSEYISDSASNPQPVLRGRLIAKPDIDLNAYHCKAVFDWIEIRLQTLATHQAMNIARYCNKHLGALGSRSKVYVSGLDRKGGFMGSDFIVRVQQPEKSEFFALLEVLVAKYKTGHASIKELQIMGLEVSVDFWVRGTAKFSADKTNLLRWQMTEVLRRHLKPGPELTEKENCFPRFYSDQGSKGSATFMLDSSLAKLTGTQIKKVAELGVETSVLVPFRLGAHQQCPIDTTNYIGAKDFCYQIRVMDKITDNRDPEKGTFDKLPLNECRSRMELTAIETPNDWNGPAGLDIATLSDLTAADLKVIRKPFFEFFLPTFNAVDELSDMPFKTNVTEHHVFERSGVYGLDRLHRSVETVGQACYKQKKVSDKPPRLGRKGRLVSYVELNRMIDRALTKLSRDWRK